MTERPEVRGPSDEAIESLSTFDDKGLERVANIVDRTIAELEVWKEYIKKERAIRIAKPE